MSLKGNTRSMKLGDLLKLIASRKSTGTFELIHGTAWKRLYFEKGTVISGASSDPSEYLGHILIAEKMITEEQMTQALEVQKKTRVMIGKILVMIGAITEADLLRILELKCRETLLSMFLWDDAEFEFFEDQLPAVRMIPASLEVEAFIEEGDTRRKEWRELRKKYPSRDMVFCKEAGHAFPANGDAFLRHLYDLTDGKRSLADLIIETHATEYRLVTAMDRLARYHMVRATSAPSPEPKPVREAFALSQVIENGKRKLAAEKFEEAINLFRYVLQHEENAEARDLLTRAEHGLLEAIYRDTIGPDAVPRLARPLESLVQERLSSEESFLVTRINGQWDMKSILTITPLREVEVLRIMKRLMDRKIVAV